MSEQLLLVGIVHNGCNWVALTSEIELSRTDSNESDPAGSSATISGSDAVMQLHIDTSQMGLTQVIPLDLTILVVPTITGSLIHRWCWGWL